MAGRGDEAPTNEELVRVSPTRLEDGDHDEASWCVYLIRVSLPLGSTALKIGMVGTGTLRRRLAQHQRHL